MNVVAAVKSYVTKMLEDSGPGMKVLLMDKQTTSIVSVVYSQSEILQKEVYLFERIDAATQQDSVRHLKCVVFVRPTNENISLLAAELKYPRYSAYYIYMSNITSKVDIKTLAESDDKELVKEVQEFYADYLAVSPHFFSLGIPCVYKDLLWNQNYIKRSIQGITAILLSLKKSPLIRYQASSRAAERLAEGVRDLINRESTLCSFRQVSDTSPVLLVLDRRDDPITPLLSQWTYQAMVHELLTITNNRVCLPDNQDMGEVVLSAEQDEFFANNLYLNFGEIAQMIKELMMDYQKKAQSHQKVESIADMKNFIESYPQFKKMSGTVSKHVNVVGELSSMIAKHCLMDVSELEQEIVAQQDHTNQLMRIRTFINNSKIRDIDATRLVLLYCLRYEQHSNNDITGLVEALRKRGVAERFTKLVGAMILYGGEKNRQGNLFGANNAVDKIKKKIIDLKGVENVFTQHTPLLRQTLDDLIKGRLRDASFPCVNESLDSQPGRRAQDIIVFMCGGVTYEEALTVHQLNHLYPGVRIVLGGTAIHNTLSFLDEVEVATDGVPRRGGARIRDV